MRYAYFPGCKIPHYVPHYGRCSQAVLGHLGVELVELEFGCCGYPMTHLYFRSAMLAAARNLALAQAAGLDMLTPCKCCFGAFMRARHALDRSPELKSEVAAALAEEGLAYPDTVKVRHILQVLHQDIGVDKLKKQVRRRFSKLRAAPLYGCHAMRPSEVTQFDHPWNPRLLDELIGLTGAESINWTGRLSCCGAPVRESNPDLSLAIIAKRMTECREAKADVLVISCPYSQMQAERAWAAPRPAGDRAGGIGAILYPQMLGVTLGLGSAELALNRTTPDAEYLLSFLE